MTKIQYIEDQLRDAKLRSSLSKVVADVDALMPQSEAEFSEIEKLGLYPAEQCVPFVTKQGTLFYQLDKRLYSYNHIENFCIFAAYDDKLNNQ